MPGRLLSLSLSEIENRLFPNVQLKQAFGFIQNAATARQLLGTCARCKKKPAQERYDKAIEELKRAVRSMNTADQAKFKQMLGVDRVRFHYTYWDGSIQKRKEADF